MSGAFKSILWVIATSVDYIRSYKTTFNADLKTFTPADNLKMYSSDIALLIV